MEEPSQLARMLPTITAGANPVSHLLSYLTEDWTVPCPIAPYAWLYHKLNTHSSGPVRILYYTDNKPVPVGLVLLKSKSC